jgi:hypothetical protein
MFIIKGTEVDRSIRNINIAANLVLIFPSPLLNTPSSKGYENSCGDGLYVLRKNVLFYDHEKP